MSGLAKKFHSGFFKDVFFRLSQVKEFMLCPDRASNTRYESVMTVLNRFPLSICMRIFHSLSLNHRIDGQTVLYVSLTNRRHYSVRGTLHQGKVIPSPVATPHLVKEQRLPLPLRHLAASTNVPRTLTVQIEWLLVKLDWRVCALHGLAARWRRPVWISVVRYYCIHRRTLCLPAVPSSLALRSSTRDARWKEPKG